MKGKGYDIMMLKLEGYNIILKRKEKKKELKI